MAFCRRGFSIRCSTLSPPATKPANASLRRANEAAIWENGRLRTAIEQLRDIAGARQVTVQAKTARAAFSAPSGGLDHIRRIPELATRDDGKTVQIISSTKSNQIKIPGYIATANSLKPANLLVHFLIEIKFKLDDPRFSSDNFSTKITVYLMHKY
jgi:hypothetical protein